jgi:hypothetical protein
MHPQLLLGPRPSLELARQRAHLLGQIIRASAFNGQ